jgi:uncharacterized protein DUF2442
MSLVRIRSVDPLREYIVRLTLSDGAVRERDLASLVVGPIFSDIRGNTTRFREVLVQGGALRWRNGVNLSDPSAPGGRCLFTLSGSFTSEKHTE